MNLNRNIGDWTSEHANLNWDIGDLTELRENG